MTIISVIRIAAVVGLSAIKIASTALKIKEAKQQGLINPMFSNNGTPYQQPIHQQPMNINNTYNSIQQPMWSESRRFMNVPTSLNLSLTPQQPQPMMPQVATLNNQPNNYTPAFNDPTSRRNMDMPVQNMYQQQPYAYNYNSQPVSNPWQPMKRLEPTIAAYNPSTYNMYQNYVSSSNVYPYGVSCSTYDTLDGYVPKSRRLPVMQNQSCIQALNWRDVWGDNKYQTCMNNSCGYSNGSCNNNKAWDEACSLPKFNWQSERLRYRPPYEDSNGVVAMFGAPDGTPLYGPPPMATGSI